jgi:hypothetical protein
MGLGYLCLWETDLSLNKLLFLLLLHKYCRLQQVVYYFISCTWQLKRVKPIYMCQLAFERGASRTDGFDRATHYYGVWQPVPVICRTRVKRFFSMLSSAKR